MGAKACALERTQAKLCTLCHQKEPGHWTVLYVLYISIKPGKRQVERERMRCGTGNGDEREGQRTYGTHEFYRYNSMTTPSGNRRL